MKNLAPTAGKMPKLMRRGEAGEDAELPAVPSLEELRQCQRPRLAESIDHPSGDSDDQDDDAHREPPPRHRESSDVVHLQESHDRDGAESGDSSRDTDGIPTGRAPCGEEVCHTFHVRPAQEDAEHHHAENGEHYPPVDERHVHSDTLMWPSWVSETVFPSEAVTVASNMRGVTAMAGGQLTPSTGASTRPSSPASSEKRPCSLKYVL